VDRHQDDIPRVDGTVIPKLPRDSEAALAAEIDIGATVSQRLKTLPEELRGNASTKGNFVGTLKSASGIVATFSAVFTR
jgi:hypothetical protein